MTKDEAQKRIEKLKKTINHYRHAYHVWDREEISIEALDSLKKELFDLEQKYPDLITKDSPTQRIGGAPLKKFEKFRHPQRMTSFNDAFSEEDMEDWLKRNMKLLTNIKRDFEFNRSSSNSLAFLYNHKLNDSGYRSSSNSLAFLCNHKLNDSGLSFYCEPKLDGLAIELVYRNGVLETGSTRGDGTIGENVTQNLRTIESIPLSIDCKKELVVRGEAVISKKEFERINKQRKKQGLSLYANPRNLAAGSIRQLDSQITKQRNLSADIYSLVSDLGQKTHAEEHELLEKLGFKTNNKYNKVCRNLEEVFLYRKNLEKIREKLPYQIDGVVITINDNKIFKKLGIVGKAPRGAIAFKFAQSQATTQVLEVEFQTGRTGAITPVAILKPVAIEGVTISRATLHNEQEIKRLDLKTGDTVIIGRAGDVIPEVVDVLKELRNGKEKRIDMPKKCLACGFDLERRSGNILWFCPNKKCYDRKLKQISHFVSKGAFNVVGLGPNIVKQLLNKKLINDAADLFSLKKGDLIELEGFEERASNNLIEAIERSKQVNLARFIYSLGIFNVGQETANLLANQFKSIDKLRKVEINDLENILDIGPVIASSIVDWFQDEHNLNLLEKLESNGVEIIFSKKGEKLKGLRFVLTGSLHGITRDEAKDRIRELGGEISSSISKNIDYVILGENPGSKYNQAKKLNIKLLKEEEFYELIKTS